MNKDQQLTYSFFQPSNALIFKDHNSHTIASFQQPQKNIQITVMIITKKSIIKTKKGDIAQFLVADQTGSCFMNFFSQHWKFLQQGDILYINGAYTSIHKGMLLIYQGSHSIIRKIGRWYMKCNLANNISLKNMQN